MFRIFYFLLKSIKLHCFSFTKNIGFWQQALCHVTRLGSCMKQAAAFQAKTRTKYDPCRPTKWIVFLLMNHSWISIPAVGKSLRSGAQFLQDRINPNSLWPSMITSQLEKHVGSNWILSFCTWYEAAASQPCYPVTVHKFFIVYWLSLSIFLIRKGAVKIHEGYGVVVGHREAEISTSFIKSAEILSNQRWFFSPSILTQSTQY